MDKGSRNLIVYGDALNEIVKVKSYVVLSNEDGVIIQNIKLFRLV